MAKLNTSKKVSSKVSTVVPSVSSNEDFDMTVTTLEKPATRIALEACQYAYEACQYAYEACIYPVEYSNVFPAPGFLYAIESAGPVVYNPRYQPATPHKIVTVVPAEITAPDLLAPYYGVQVKLTYRAAPGMEFDLANPLGEHAKARAQEIANAKKFNVQIKDMATDTVILTVVPGSKSFSKSVTTSTRKVSGGTSVKVVTALSAEEIARKEEEERLAKIEAAEEAHSIMITKAYNKALPLYEKFKIERAEEISKALAVQWNKPEYDTEQYHQFMMFSRIEGATPKEQNLAWDIRNLHADKKANFGWKQIAQKFVTTYTGYVLLQTSRPDESATGDARNVLRPAFRIATVNELMVFGEMVIPAGWYNITPVNAK
jgi:hypothetical protein